VTAFRPLPSAIQDCIGNCTACERLCLETMAHCRQRGGDFAETPLLAALALCAELCRDTASTVQDAAGEAQLPMLRACAVACERGAKLCDDFPSDNMLRACGNACRLAARACTGLAHVV
jgi:hypothetical protein